MCRSVLTPKQTLANGVPGTRLMRRTCLLSIPVITDGTSTRSPNDVRYPPKNFAGQAAQTEFCDYPGQQIVVFSDDLARYLRGLGSDQVDVTFGVTVRWGRTREFREISIGELLQWRAEGRYVRIESVTGQGPSRSPFP